MSAYNLYNESAAIGAFLTQIDTENTNVQAGKSTVFDVLPTLLTNMLALIALTKSDFMTTYFTDAQITDYNAGNIVLSDVVNHNLVTLFNTIEKISLLGSNMLGNILSTPKQSVISFYANADDYTLTQDQFEGTGAGKVLNNSTFEYYTIQLGDTARIIANRELGDPEKYISILQINSITESKLMSGSLVGRQIKIPITSSLVSQNQENMVFESDFSMPSQFFHGSDIAPGINNTIEVSASGDILGATGQDVTTNSINARLSTRKGTLNVFSPNFGLISIGDGNAPLMVQINNYLTDFVNQIQEDPRVSSVQLNTSSIRWDGETLSANATVAFLGSDKTQVVSI